jgi:hypothetical protein
MSMPSPQETEATSFNIQIAIIGSQAPIGESIDKLQTRGVDEHDTHWPQSDYDERDIQL